MAKDYALALQAGVFAALKADAGVATAVSGRVYDEPPQSAAFPYIRFGAFEPRPVRSDCASAARVTFSIEVHSRPNAGRVEATRIAGAVVAALNEREDAVTVAGYTVVRLQWMTQTTGRADDGQSYLALVAFEALLDG
ncbi:DUF3168 domain-containing protein [Limimaricola cinnabarinus]|uniref:DUF3168 domain-containing protein n=1 Tax=Limimaricola cinnabarinus TaxID=1125964 RepID=UPI002491E115|nr:DUF3168 domain-containing protein [Limimaricola cinnabarinus]